MIQSSRRETDQGTDSKEENRTHEKLSLEKCLEWAKEKNCFKRLGLEPTANFEQIKKRYRKICFIIHPDVSEKDKDSCLEAQKRINDAWETLRDEGKRKEERDGYYKSSTANTGRTNTQSNESGSRTYINNTSHKTDEDINREHHAQAKVRSNQERSSSANKSQNNFNSAKMPPRGKFFPRKLPLNRTLAVIVGVAALHRIVSLDAHEAELALKNVKHQSEATQVPPSQTSNKETIIKKPDAAVQKTPLTSLEVKKGTALEKCWNNSPSFIATTKGVPPDKTSSKGISRAVDDFKRSNWHNPRIVSNNLLDVALSMCANIPSTFSPYGSHPDGVVSSIHELKKKCWQNRGLVLYGDREVDLTAVDVKKLASCANSKKQ